MAGPHIRHIRDLSLEFVCGGMSSCDNAENMWDEVTRGWGLALELLLKNRVNLKTIRVQLISCCRDESRSCEYLDGLLGYLPDFLLSYTFCREIILTNVPKELAYHLEKGLSWKIQPEVQPGVSDGYFYDLISATLVNPTFPKEYNWNLWVHRRTDLGDKTDNWRYDPDDDRWKSDEILETMTLEPEPEPEVKMEPKIGFLDFPREIRDKIYDLAFSKRRFVSWREHEHAGAGLLRTCRQIRREARPRRYRTLELRPRTALYKLKYHTHLDLVKEVEIQFNCYCPNRRRLDDVVYPPSPWSCSERSGFYPGDIELIEGREWQSWGWPRMLEILKKHCLQLQHQKIVFDTCYRFDPDYIPRFEESEKWDHNNLKDLQQHCVALASRFLDLLEEGGFPNLSLLTLAGDVPPSAAYRLPRALGLPIRSMDHDLADFIYACQEEAEAVQPERREIVAEGYEGELAEWEQQQVARKDRFREVARFPRSEVEWHIDAPPTLGWRSTLRDPWEMERCKEDEWPEVNCWDWMVRSTDEAAWNWLYIVLRNISTSAWK
ncbi:hypothetical protein B0T26DRAFT_673427 [Lasiosphaeria miniovina]|uniref:F-box domain-containing protein n=1 Tax=Lasiosphaeria miniovina TaxID=1954250 RepID=A0AA40ATE5_9PEZI|nr:uncharacterized protein B0T26DRAFT_673427 [Lasiosphaeria miniovina]KAK0721628.1 hypothetical protein B0T26DRAFT_673427 [Lasiosphaeria miniovina]